MNVASYMSSPIVSIGSHHSIAEATELMGSQRVRHLAVLDDDTSRPLGVLSENDVFRIRATKPLSPEVLWVGEAMNPACPTMGVGMPLALVAGELLRSGHDAALIEDRGQVVGIFTTTDALRALVILAR